MEKAINSILVGGEDVEIIVVNDGSKDATWDEIQKAHRNNEKVCGVCFSGGSFRF